jgi:hypothetical protein
MSQTTTPSLARVQPTTRLRAPVIVVVPPAGGSRAARARRARAAVAWGVVAFALANLTLAVAVETALPELRDPEYGYRMTRLCAQHKAHPDRPLVLLLGTSRVQNALDPAAMGFPDEPGSPLVFNFGLSGAHPLRQRLVLQALEAEGVKPAAVVVEVFSATLVVSGSAGRVLARDAVRFTYADVSRAAPYSDDPFALRRMWAAGRLNTMGTEQPVILSHLAPEWQPWSMRVDHYWNMLEETGFTAIPHENADEHRARRQARIRAEYATILKRVEVSELTARVHRDIVADCRARGIPVAFVITPESPEFRSWYSPESRKAVADYVRVLTDELGCAAFTPSNDYAEDDFADGHHMLAPAARRFSREFADNHLKPWLAAGR